MSENVYREEKTKEKVVRILPFFHPHKNTDQRHGYQEGESGRMGEKGEREYSW